MIVAARQEGSAIAQGEQRRIRAADERRRTGLPRVRLRVVEGRRAVGDGEDTAIAQEGGRHGVGERGGGRCGPAVQRGVVHLGRGSAADEQDAAVAQGERAVAAARREQRRQVAPGIRGRVESLRLIARRGRRSRPDGAVASGDEHPAVREEGGALPAQVAGRAEIEPAIDARVVAPGAEVAEGEDGAIG
jgi:hypothetical protein